MTDSAAEYVPLAELKPWAKNPRRNDAAVKRVADSIRRFGFGAPIVARLETKQIIAGHTRWKAGKLLGLKTVPVRFLDVSERDAELLALADNKLGEIATWDDSLVGEILSTASFGDALLAGWDGSELGKLADGVLGDLAGDNAAKLGASLTYSVVVECECESHQAELLERLEADGLKCRPLIA